MRFSKAKSAGPQTYLPSCLLGHHMLAETSNNFLETLGPIYMVSGTPWGNLAEPLYEI